MQRGLFLTLGLGAALAFARVEAQPSPIPVETLLKDYEALDMQLSPDGKHLAAVAPYEGKLGVVVMDLATRAAIRVAQPARYSQRPPAFTWISDRRLLVGTDTGYYGVDYDGGRLKAIVEPASMRSRDGWHVPSGSAATLNLQPDPQNNDDSILIQDALSRVTPSGRFNGVPATTIFKVDTVTGERHIQVPRQEGIINWFFDNAGKLRLAVGNEKEKRFLIYRESETSAWKRIATWERNSESIRPVGFTPDNKLLYVLSNMGRDTFGLFKYDPQSNKLGELLFGVEGYDVKYVVQSPVSKLPECAYFTAGRERTHWFDSKKAKIQESIDATLKETVNTLHWPARDSSHALVYSYGDRHPGTYYLLETASMKLEKLGEKAPWLNPSEMAETKTIQYRSRDGLVIHGFLTLPRAHRQSKVPLVVSPMSCPWSPTGWSFDRDAQFLASRGYAVLAINHRGSSGYGLKFLRAGLKEWSRNIPNDINDGVKWAVDQGFADPSRVAIYGNLYGGFVALSCLVSSPELYKCGITYGGINDFRVFLNFCTDLNPDEFRELTEWLGDPKKESALVSAASPLNRLDSLKAPLMLIYGKNDQSAGFEQAERLQSALKAKRKSFTSLIEPEEGAVFHKEKNKINLFIKLERFLRDNL